MTVIKFLVFFSSSSIALCSSLALCAAEIGTFEKFRGLCNKQIIADDLGKKVLPYKLPEQFQKEVCEAYIKGYLAVANHDCQFDIYSDNLHKLDTKHVSIKQIIKALEIYDQKLGKGSNGVIIDHLWSAFSPHWPCQTR